MNNIQKTLLIIGTISFIILLMISIASGKFIMFQYNVFPLSPNPYYEWAINWKSFIPFLITLASAMGFFLFKDK
jgi:hypothetical protein